VQNNATVSIPVYCDDEFEVVTVDPGHETFYLESPDNTGGRLSMAIGDAPKYFQG